MLGECSKHLFIKYGLALSCFNNFLFKNKKNMYPKAYFYKKIVTAKLFIDAHYAEDIDVDNIANEACFSKFDFIRQFKKVYQKTPYNYLKMVRMEEAKKRLELGKSIQTVCFEVGYTSVSSFSGLFKKVTGMTPTAYQKAHVEKTTGIQEQPLTYVPGCFSSKKGWKKSNFEENA